MPGDEAAFSAGICGGGGGGGNGEDVFGDGGGVGGALGRGTLMEVFCLW